MKVEHDNLGTIRALEVEQVTWLAVLHTTSNGIYVYQMALACDPGMSLEFTNVTYVKTWPSGQAVIGGTRYNVWYGKEVVNV